MLKEERGKSESNLKVFLLCVTWSSALESMWATCWDLVSSGESSDVNALTPHRSCGDYGVIWLRVKWKRTQEHEGEKKSFQRLFSGLKEIRWVLWLFYHFLMPGYLRCAWRNAALAAAVAEFTREFELTLSALGAVPRTVQSPLLGSENSINRSVAPSPSPGLEVWAFSLL